MYWFDFFLGYFLGVITLIGCSAMIGLYTYRHPELVSRYMFRRTMRSQAGGKK